MVKQSQQSNISQRINAVVSCFEQKIHQVTQDPLTLKVLDDEISREEVSGGNLIGQRTKAYQEFITGLQNLISQYSAKRMSENKTVASAFMSSDARAVLAGGAPDKAVLCELIARIDQAPIGQHDYQVVMLRGLESMRNVLAHSQKIEANRESIFGILDAWSLKIKAGVDIHGEAHVVNDVDKKSEMQSRKLSHIKERKIIYALMEACDPDLAKQLRPFLNRLLPIGYVDPVKLNDRFKRFFYSIKQKHVWENTCNLADSFKQSQMLSAQMRLAAEASRHHFSVVKEVADDQMRKWVDIKNHKLRIFRHHLERMLDSKAPLSQDDIHICKAYMNFLSIDQASRALYTDLLVHGYSDKLMRKCDIFAIQTLMRAAMISDYDIERMDSLSVSDIDRLGKFEDLNPNIDKARIRDFMVLVTRYCKNSSIKSTLRKIEASDKKLEILYTKRNDLENAIKRKDGINKLQCAILLKQVRLAYMLQQQALSTMYSVQKKFNYGDAALAKEAEFYDKMNCSNPDNYTENYQSLIDFLKTADRRNHSLATYLMEVIFDNRVGLSVFNENSASDLVVQLQQITQKLETLKNGFEVDAAPGSEQSGSSAVIQHRSLKIYQTDGEISKAIAKKSQNWLFRFWDSSSSCERNEACDQVVALFNKRIQ